MFIKTSAMQYMLPWAAVPGAPLQSLNNITSNQHSIFTLMENAFCPDELCRSHIAFQEGMSLNEDSAAVLLVTSERSLHTCSVSSYSVL